MLTDRQRQSQRTSGSNSRSYGRAFRAKVPDYYATRLTPPVPPIIIRPY